MATLLTYDIPQKHHEFKDEMLNKGYVCKLQGNTCKTIYLPNTTLYHETKTPTEAREDAKCICSDLSIDLERFAATNWGSEWAVLCGEPFKS